MAVKNLYSIPNDINTHIVDVEINLFSEASVLRSKRPITLKVIGLIVLSLVVWTALVAGTDLKHGGFFQLFAFSFGYFWFSYLMTLMDVTRLIGLSLLKPMMNYLSKDNRYIMTRNTSIAWRVKQLVHVKEIVPETGRILFDNGDLGYVLEVTGNASLLMFEKDRNTVISNTHNFFRGMTANSSIGETTEAGPQRVVEQLAYLEQQQRNLATNSKGLRELQEKEYEALKYHAGRDFESIHQFLEVRAKSETSLEEVMERIHAYSGSDVTYIRSYEILDAERAESFYVRLYKGNLE
jgi:hypothetical protein